MGSLPQGWTLDPSAMAACRFEVTADPERRGKRCAVLFRKTLADSEASDAVVALGGAALRGLRVRLRADMRVAVGKGLPRVKGRIWIVDGQGKVRVLDSMDDRPVIAHQWAPCEWVVDVPDDTVELHFGVGLKEGSGKAWISPLLFDSLGPAPSRVVTSARPLDAQGRVNLLAFAKAYGCLRFFHPSAGSVDAHWNQLAVDGIREAEEARGAMDLAARLQGLFQAFAPGVVFDTSDRPVPSPDLSRGGAPLVRYVHKGYGGGKFPYFYSSTLEEIRPGDPARLDVLAHANQTVNLGGDVFLHYSLLCGKDQVAQASSTGGATPSLTGLECDRVEDRSVRLGDVIIAWNILRNFSPYADMAGMDWDAELARALEAAASEGEAPGFLHALRRMVAALKDGHGGAFAPLLGEHGVPDVRVAMVEGVPRVIACGPGVKDLPLGSEIVSVDGEPVPRRMAYFREEISRPTPGWQDSELADRLLEGRKVDPARIGFKPPAGSAGTVVLPRNGKPWILSFPGTPSKIAEIKPGVWYLDLDRITNAEFDSLLPRLREAGCLIFDLRRYSTLNQSFLQHLSTERLDQDLFDLPITTAPDGQGRTWWRLGGPNPKKVPPLRPYLKGKAVFLAGGASISAMETMLGEVILNRLGTIVGECSAGTNGNINIFWLPGRYQVVMTGIKATKHDGTRHYGVGFAPDVPCKPTVQGVAMGRDEVLEKGLEIAAGD